MRRSTTALIFGVALSAGVFSGVAVAQQQSPVPGMSSDDLNTALDFAKAGLNKASTRRVPIRRCRSRIRAMCATPARAARPSR